MILLLLFVLLLPSLADAACTGSGLTWSCPAGESAANINSAISNASDGATITFEAGSYSAADISLNPRDGLTLICASEGACTMSAGRVFRATHSTLKTAVHRISGFVFSAATGSPVIDLGFSAGDPGYTQMRIDHNTFQQSDNYSISTGSTSATRAVLGVIDHNTFSASTHLYPLLIFGGGDNDWGGSWQGTEHNLFFEDNTMTYTSENLAASGMDVWHGGRFVVRHNNITNARIAVHGVCHNGPANLEVYGNTLVGTTGSSDGYRIIHHQGSGEIMIFDNTTSPTQSTMALLHYRSSNPNPEGCGVCNGSDGSDGNRPGQNGYPCYRQPGRTGNADLKPIYLWKNRYTSGGAKWDLSVESAGGTSLLSSHIQANRDYYEAPSASAQSSPTSPFNGTTGTGFGTLANRPTTCTTNSAESGGGVGYFATDQGSQGTLYRCSATNTWTVHYTPYTYPHPLVAGSSDPEDHMNPSRFMRGIPGLKYDGRKYGW